MSLRPKSGPGDGRTMKCARISEEQFIRVLKGAEAGAKTADLQWIS